MDKIFCLGYMSTGNKTLHATAEIAGLRGFLHGSWGRSTKSPEFREYVDRHNSLPPADHPAGEEFHNWQDYDFFSDGNAADFKLLDALFPGSYFILNTRSRYNWLTGIYNHLQRNRHDPNYTGSYVNKPTAEFLGAMMRTRMGYHRRVIRYFRQRSNFAVVDVEAQAESQVCEVLQTAMGKPVERLHTIKGHKGSEGYDMNPKVVEEALSMREIPKTRWHVSLP